VAKILIFSPSTKKPIYETTYPTYISSIKWNNEQDFVFMDMNSRIAMITTSKIPTDTTGNSITDSGLDHTQEIAQLLTAAQASNVTLGDDAMDVDNADEINGFDKRLDVNSFFNLFENIEGDIKLDTMFERVMQVIN
jgi:NET1-associated nuclear protein 1 (U3 small nucleolar RNA-associated protein 17)